MTDYLNVLNDPVYTCYSLHVNLHLSFFFFKWLPFLTKGVYFRFKLVSTILY